MYKDLYDNQANYHKVKMFLPDTQTDGSLTVAHKCRVMNIIRLEYSTLHMYTMLVFTLNFWVHHTNSMV